MTFDMRSADRPMPEKDGVSSEFWEACTRGELLIQRCPSCGNRQFYPRAACTECGGTPEWERASGRGTLHTFTVIRQNHAKPFRDLVPYVVAMVELEEGPRLMGNLAGVDPDAGDVRIGMPVEVFFEAGVEGEDYAVPYWRPATA